LVSNEDVAKLVESGRRSFGSWAFIKQLHDSGRGWPYEPNQMFKLAAQWVAKNQAGPFFWCEADCIPVKSGWLSTLEAEYKAKRVSFMGTIYPHPIKHLNGCMVYPQVVGLKNPAMTMATTKAWDLMAPGQTLKYGFNTPLIQRMLADPQTNTAMTFPDRASLNVINPKAVVFHGCRDMTLIRQLREHGPLQSSGYALSGPHFDNDDTLEKMILSQTVPAKRQRLHGVTLWACCWSADATNLDRTVRVLNYCRKFFEFDDILLFSHLALPHSAIGWCRYIQIPHLDMNGFNIFVNRVAPLAIETRYAMAVHEDGFPIMPSLWRNEFLDYDYIGAPWNDGVVGNGGFSIESRKLLIAKMALPPYPTPNSKVASDYYVCRVHRKALEDQGIRFAPVELAIEFSTELTGHPWPSYGFHGRHRQAQKYKLGWELIRKLEQPEPVPIPTPVIPGEPLTAEQAAVRILKQFGKSLAVLAD